VNTYMRVLITSLASVAALCLVAGPAEAKSGLTVSVVPVVVRGAPTDEFRITASGGDDAAGYQRLCLQESSGAAWRTLTCGPVELGTGGTVRAIAWRTGSRSQSVRAELLRVARHKGSKTVVDLVSSPIRLVSRSRSASEISGTRTRGSLCL